MKKTAIIISSLLLVAFAAASTFAWGPGTCQGIRGQGYKPDCPRYGGNSAAANDLSKEQVEQLTALRQEFIDDTYELRSAKMVARQKMQMLMETSNPDRGELSDLTDEIADLQKQLMDKRIDLRLSAKKIAPELTKGCGFGKGSGRWSGKCGKRGLKGGGGGYIQQKSPSYDN